jgi:hypothetical protein
LGNEVARHFILGQILMRSPEDHPNVIGLIVAADEPALFFSSPEVAEKYLEAVDVRSGVYTEAYGPKGEPYDIMADQWDGVVINPRTEYATQPHRLRKILESFLKACGLPFSTDMSLQDLIALCNPYVDDGM